jgi:phosphoesterase RecJ-like protein
VVVAPNKFPDFYNWMPGIDAITIYEDQKERALALIQAADVVFCLDYNDLRRTGPITDDLTAYSGKFVMIDHHQEPTDFAQITISQPGKSSTCEMVFEVIQELGHADQITLPMGECLYTGMLTDTGSFRFNSTTKETHLAVAYLLGIGVSPDEVYAKVHDNNSLNRTRLLGYLLAEKLQQVDDLPVMYISLNAMEQERFKFQKGDSEGFETYGLGVKGMKVAGFFRESEGFVKVSLRSKGTFDVNKIARAHFNGGGHVNAAGGKLELSIPQAIAHFESVIKQYAHELE